MPTDDLRPDDIAWDWPSGAIRPVAIGDSGLTRGFGATLARIVELDG